MLERFISREKHKKEEEMPVFTKEEAISVVFTKPHTSTLPVDELNKITDEKAKNTVEEQATNTIEKQTKIEEPSEMINKSENNFYMSDKSMTDIGSEVAKNQDISVIEDKKYPNLVDEPAHKKYDNLVETSTTSDDDFDDHIESFISNTEMLLNRINKALDDTSSQVVDDIKDVEQNDIENNQDKIITELSQTDFEEKAISDGQATDLGNANIEDNNSSEEVNDELNNNINENNISDRDVYDELSGVISVSSEDKSNDETVADDVNNLSHLQEEPSSKGIYTNLIEHNEEISFSGNDDESQDEASEANVKYITLSQLRDRNKELEEKLLHSEDIKENDVEDIKEEASLVEDHTSSEESSKEEVPKVEDGTISNPQPSNVVDIRETVLPKEIQDILDGKTEDDKKSISKGMPMWAKSAIACGLTIVIIGGAAIGFMVGTKMISPPQFGKTNQVSTMTVSSYSKNENLDIAKIVKNTMPSIVSVTNMTVGEVNSYFSGDEAIKSKNVGSGIILDINDNEVLIVTNNHVIKNNDSLTVTFADNQSVDAYVKGSDNDSDLAVIAVRVDNITTNTLKKIKKAVLGNSSLVAVGEESIAIGNTLGVGQSVTQGIISAKDIKISKYSGRLLQTDAAINPGNSGGPLLNNRGEVIGINSSKVSEDTVEGIGYAIPISDAMDEVKTMMNKEPKEKVASNKRGTLGINGVDVSKDSSETYDIPEGILISGFTDGSKASEGGLSEGNVIVSIEGKDVSSLADLNAQLSYYKAGQKVKVIVKAKDPSTKEYKDKKVTVTLVKE
ncbi:MAG: trypsin-like peptidase domain-containing protein [Lachnospiraceae bacterium]|jgi:serine protease Do|nr:trypsin-like peptidase domain-containing protein [Lachnospiraceae bacterium]